LLVEIVDREMNWCDSMLLVQLAHIFPVDPSVFVIDFSLHIEHPSDASLRQLYNIVFLLRVGPNENRELAYFIKVESTYKVGIDFVHKAIHNEDLVNVGPPGGLPVSQLSIVVLWPLEIDIARGFTLPDVVIFRVVPN
jgi:hypothetical protein